MRSTIPNILFNASICFTLLLLRVLVLSILIKYLNLFSHTSQPVSFNIRDNGPPGSMNKNLKSQSSRLLEMHFQL